MTSRQQETESLLKDIVELCQSQAILLEAIVVTIERMNGPIPEARDLSTIVSQWSGLHLRALDLVGDR